MDILQRECQRQYLESMGMVTDGMNKPKVDSISGLSPSISISQGINSRNPRSTVGTFTEILTYLRILYAKFGVRKCPDCHLKINPDFSESALSESDGKEQLSCPHCHSSLPVLRMAHFSFNKSEGFCDRCSGIGIINDMDLSSLIDDNLRISEGAVKLWQGIFAESYENVMVSASEHFGFRFDPHKAVKEFDDIEKLVFYHGVECDEFKALFPDIPPPKRVFDGRVEGVHSYMRKKSAENIRKGSGNRMISTCFTTRVCPECQGSRLKQGSRDVLVNDKSIVEVSGYSLDELFNWLQSLGSSIDKSGAEILRVLSNDMVRRLRAVINIGLSYLSLDRSMSTLSGGEVQRLRLARLMDSGLTGVLYILDEPTAGLHPRDTEKILKSLKKLRDLGNTILIIEHDMRIVRECDHIIDFGPGSGSEGGLITASGSPSEIMENASSLTGHYLKKNSVNREKSNRTTDLAISIRGARKHNLKNLTLDIPLNCLVAVTGISGSGKSSLILDTLTKKKREDVDEICGLEYIDRIIELDQKGIGRSSRSNVATYTEIFTFIRNIFASLPDAKKMKLKSRDFSFNVKGGRCEKCLGLGSIPLDMHFLEDIEVECPVCHGKRFHHETLNIRYKDLNISEILDMTVKDNIQIFREHGDVFRRLEILDEVGLGYLTLGQSSSTLSGGECQRMKLSRELGKADKGHFLYLLDEPTTGLHPCDSEKLIAVLNKLINKGHSVLIIEHSMDVVARSDWVIDLGPEGGAAGGRLVAQGTPEDIRNCAESHTARYL